MFKKLKKFYKNNRVYSILMLISVICITAIVVGIILYFLGQTNKNKYGNRLEIINGIEFTNKNISSIEEYYKANEKVKSIEINVKGPIIYVNIILNNGTYDDVKLLVQDSLELFSEEVKKSYEIHFNVDNNDKESDDKFPISGKLKRDINVVKWPVNIE